MSAAPMLERVSGLDVLRGIAALVVVLFHYTAKLPDFYPMAKTSPIVFEYGFYGVHLFFIVSGFVILMSLERREGKGFVQSRFIRLYPLFWASVILTHLVLSLNEFIPYDISTSALLVNFTMLQDYARVPAVDGVYWSLSYELGFYAFMYAVFKFKLKLYVSYLPLVFTVFGAAFLVAERYVPHPLHYLLVANSYAHLFACGLAFT